MTFVNARRGMYGSAFRCHLAILQCSVNSRFETEPERVRFGRCVWTCFAFTNFFHEFTLPAKLCDFSRLLHHLAKSLWPRCQCWQLVSAFHSAFLFFFFDLFIFHLIPNTRIQINFLADGISQCFQIPSFRDLYILPAVHPLSPLFSCVTSVTYASALLSL